MGSGCLVPILGFLNSSSGILGPGIRDPSFRIRGSGFRFRVLGFGSPEDCARPHHNFGNLGFALRVPVSGFEFRKGTGVL